jgi:hypothetical protein
MPFDPSFGQGVCCSFFLGAASGILEVLRNLIAASSVANVAPRPLLGDDMQQLAWHRLRD